MPTELQGSAVSLQISTNLTTPAYKDVICRDSVELSNSAPVNRRSTACGSFAAVGQTEHSISFSGVASIDPATSTQMSHKDLLGIQVNKTRILAKLADIATPANLLASGQGYISELTISAPHDDLVEFTMTIEITGALSLV